MLHLYLGPNYVLIQYITYTLLKMFPILCSMEADAIFPT